VEYHLKKFQSLFKDDINEFYKNAFQILFNLDKKKIDYSELKEITSTETYDTIFAITKTGKDIEDVAARIQNRLEKARDARIKSMIEKGAGYVKLTDKNVLNIVKLVNLGEKTRVEISKEFNVQPSVITRIMTGERWGHLTGIKFVPSTKNISKDLGIEKAREVRQIYAKGETTYEDLGKLYNISKSAIASIVRNKNYKE
jgi:hypothetical protein